MRIGLSKLRKLSSQNFHIKHFRPKAVLTSFVVSILGLGLVFLPTASAAVPVNWDGNGATGGICNDIRRDPNVPAGQQQWLFILTSPDTGPWYLTTVFDPATQTPSNPIAGVQQGGGSIHFTVTTALGAELQSATATNGTANSQLTVSHCSIRSQLVVTKTANTSYTRDYDWTIAKSVDAQGTVLLSPGQQHTLNYSVVVTKDAGTDSGWSVSGSIQVTNPDPTLTANGISVTDTISGIGAATVSCPGTSLAPGASMTCTYGPVSLPDATTRLNTATATTTTTGILSGSGTADVTFGAPTTVSDNCVAISDSLQGVLGSNVCGSTTYSYSRVINADDLPCGQSTINNTASLVSDDGQTETSNATVTVNVACVLGCTLTQGYWKTHNVLFKGGAPADDTWNLLPGGQGPSTTFFLSGQTWYGVFWTAPAGNAYYNLADQYMAARLNILNGASAPAAVNTAITQSTALFNTYTPAQIAALKGNSTLRAQFVTLAGILGSYNEGITGPGHCTEQVL